MGCTAGGRRREFHCYERAVGLYESWTKPYAYVGGNPVSRVDPLGLWTVQVGGTINFQLGPVNFQVSVEIAVDGNGNIGGYGAYGGGLGEGAQVSGGLSVNSSIANTMPASGVLKAPDRPAAAPANSRLRSSRALGRG